MPQLRLVRSQVTGAMAVRANSRDIFNGIWTALVKWGDVVNLKESPAVFSREWPLIGT